MKLYISIPITGYAYEEQKAKAELLRYEYMRAGWEKEDIVTPFDIVTSQDMPYSHCIGLCVEALLECTHIVMADNWYRSKGCRIEHGVAETLNLTILKV